MLRKNEEKTPWAPRAAKVKPRIPRAGSDVALRCATAVRAAPHASSADADGGQPRNRTASSTQTAFTPSRQVIFLPSAYVRP